MKSLSWIAVILASAALGGSTNPAHRIVGGKEVKPAFKYGFMASLLKFGDHFCGGTFYNERTVITAAHCTYTDVADKYFKIVYHRHDFTKSESDEKAKSFDVTSRLPHPDYVAGEYKYDVALWKFNKDKGTTINPKVILDDGKHAANTNMLLIVAGWGYTKAGGRINDKLMEVKIPVFDTKTCAANHLRLKKDVVYPEVQFCAGYPEGGKDACQSDSGGPLFTFKDKSPVLVGIVSWGNGCAEKDLPGVYTKVAKVAGWIKNNA